MLKQFVVFPLEDELYGVDIHQVMRIEKMLSLTRVPNAPPFVIGVCNLRGSVIPVIDLKQRLALPSNLDENAKIIFVNVGKQVVGMTIDSAVDVTSIDSDEIEPSPSLVTGIDSQFIQGVAKVSNRLLIILDMERVLTVDQLNVLADMD
ncbi:MAG: chemotaxis protein CheW [Bacillota bacterium]|jgi:purine-binding chemotaxis protein CheW|nr:chemotaxis protein CheW [Bacillota bacterium]HOC05836.1 chemotaxis protein CheW [Bacillota bacterium]HPZ21714.1 chemotaxis protein CheW [Bacillota bacterium]HQD19551.1 chemotaxis protein CheW [Bacillota bacterium]